MNPVEQRLALQLGTLMIEVTKMEAHIEGLQAQLAAKAATEDEATKNEMASGADLVAPADAKPEPTKPSA